MMKTYQLLYLLLFAFAACIKESNTISNTRFENTTSHVIQVAGYKDGSHITESSFVLAAGEIRQVFNLNNRGIGSGLTFGSYNQPVDSFVVIFDDTCSIVHYKSNLVGNSAKKYLYASKRNIYNDSSYQPNLIVDSKYRREWDFKYSFVEQDFLDAR